MPLIPDNKKSGRPKTTTTRNIKIPRQLLLQRAQKQSRRGERSLKKNYGGKNHHVKNAGWNSFHNHSYDRLDCPENLDYQREYGVRGWSGNEREQDYGNFYLPTQTMVRSYSPSPFRDQRSLQDDNKNISILNRRNFSWSPSWDRLHQSEPPMRNKHKKNRNKNYWNNIEDELIRRQCRICNECIQDNGVACGICLATSLLWMLCG